MTQSDIILASGSTSRRTMLETAGVMFTTAVPAIDEEAVKTELLAEGLEAGELADALAAKKAESISGKYPDALVLGADQVLVCGGQLFNKALDADAARTTLRALSGRTHELISAAVLVRDGALVWRYAESAQLTMRDLSDTFLHDYLTAEIPDVLGSVGCYRIEGRGAQLFSDVKGDHFCIRGLPLIPLLNALRRFGGLPS